MIIGFDYDGTLVTSWTADPLPGVREALAALPPGAQTFIATNQADPLFRAILGDPKYPTAEDVARRLAGGLRALKWRPDLLLICTAPPPEYAHDSRWQAAAYSIAVSFPVRDGRRQRLAPYLFIRDTVDYRKPAPGMIEQAARHVGALPAEAVYIGDMASDEEAAVAAGARFLDAAEWRANPHIAW